MFLALVTNAVVPIRADHRFYFHAAMRHASSGDIAPIKSPLRARGYIVDVVCASAGASPT